ncbi:unconventional prefoldin RPB5 interactor isoform X2 [Nematostella vectensis]|uniref:unconventional prefoldin RPB5 interactor isoform X2 n=1 Tax=Nematostella vectensis TaxID=45351 RepID=UPI0020778AB1|nr:unconventional prefoldin RPB5 interactor isoform X2 [Nematostella vectensis]
MAGDVYDSKSRQRINDLAEITRLQEHQRTAIIDCQTRLRTWEKFKSDYETLDNTLKTLPEKLNHDIMVPFGSLAFMPGKLIHTNEILVLLGDNWFAERSATQAREIVQRRQNDIETNIKGIKADIESFTSQLQLSQEFGKITEDKSDFIEIKEEIKSDSEKQVSGKGVRKAHAKAKDFFPKRVEGLKGHKTSSINTKVLSTEEMELFAKLDQLEIEETCRNELSPHFEETPVNISSKSQNIFSISGEESKLQGEETKQEFQVPERGCIQFKDDLDSDDEESEVDDDARSIPVRFSPRENKESQVQEESSKFESPADIYKLIDSKPRGILKSPSFELHDDVPQAPSDEKIPEAPRPVKDPDFQPLKAFSGHVVEKKATVPSVKEMNSPLECSKPSKKMSKFKAGRKARN